MTARHPHRTPDAFKGIMQRRLPCAIALCALMAGCATDKPAPPTVHHKRPAAVKPPSPAAATPAPSPVAANPPAAPVTPTTVPTTAPVPPEQPRVTAATEWQQLAPYLKSPLQIFSLAETQAGLQPVPGVVGVYRHAVPTGNTIRLRLALRPDSPVRLAAGRYMVQLQLSYDYTEHRTCMAASCNGEIIDTSRRAGKTVRLQLAPQQGYVAETTLPLAPAQPGMPDRDYRVSYTDLALTVRRITITQGRK